MPLAYVHNDLRFLFNHKKDDNGHFYDSHTPPELLNSLPSDLPAALRYPIYAIFLNHDTASQTAPPHQKFGSSA